ncbi:MAG: DNA polymerase [Clostridia bacterium]
MRHISVDIETYSDINLKTSGAYKYALSPNFEILLIAWAVGDGPVTVIDLTASNPDGDAIRAFMAYLRATDVCVHAYNAVFEWWCLSQHMPRLGYAVDAENLLRRMRCTMLHGLYCGYPMGLGNIGAALHLPEDRAKLGVGRALIRTFCVPQPLTKTNGGRTRILPEHEPEKWMLFKTYCAQDVVAEREVEKQLSAWPVPDEEQHLWALDTGMNARGVAIDRQLVAGALSIGVRTTAQLMDEARAISGLENPKSCAQLTKWLNTELSDEADLTNLRKDTVQELLLRGVDSASATRMLELRQQLGKTSTKKYDALAAACCADGRVRGLLQFYGAARTGRWAGRLVQVQNLPRNYLETLDFARSLACAGSLEALALCYGNVPDTLSQLIRTAIIPSPGNTLVVADYSAIEARVIAWLAGETWRQNVFATHGKIYEASASAMFGVPIEQIKKGNPEYALRQKGKVAELALGYGGSCGALIAMGALEMGLTEDELPDIVGKWRAASPAIVRLWRSLENAALQVLRTGESAGIRGLVLSLTGDTRTGQRFLNITLPSGRTLFYAQPEIGENRFGRAAIRYAGNDQKTKKWNLQETFGGKLTENVVQAIARDCLAELICRLSSRGLCVVFHVHDEVIIDTPDAQSALQIALEEMARPIDWAPGLRLKGAGFSSIYYMKD